MDAAGGVAVDLQEARERPASEKGEPAPPCLADLVDEIAATILRHALLPADEIATLVSLWIAGTYCFRGFRYTGYLALRSATPRCGKSRLLRLVSAFAEGNPPVTSIPTAATIFRSGRSVLLLDEVDKLRNQDKDTYGEVLAVLNVGFERGAVIERCKRSKGGEFTIERFDAYGPKALAGIEALADTLSDRSFQVQMKRATKRLPRLSGRRLDPIAERLRTGLSTWALANEKQISDASEGLPDEVPSLAGFDDRMQDISEPLLILALLADAERPEGPAVLPRLLSGLRAAAGRREPTGREEGFRAFLAIVEEKLGTATEVFIPSTDLLAACREEDELSWIESGRGLAGFLRHFDLAPRQKGGGKVRGYFLGREWLTEWAERYIPPVSSVTSVPEARKH